MHLYLEWLFKRRQFSPMWLKKYSWCLELKRILTAGSVVVIATLAILPFVTEKRVRYLPCRVHPTAHDPYRFNHDNWESSFDEEIVPNIIHFYRTENDVNQLGFVDAVCLLAAFRFAKPDKIIIHTEDVLAVTYSLSKSSYGQRLMDVPGFKEIIDVQYWPVPKHVFGLEFSNTNRKKHISDVTRLRILRKYGGIFLDNHALILKDPKLLRHYEMAALFNEVAELGNNMIAAHRDSRMLELWLKSYHEYEPKVAVHHHSKHVTSLLTKTTFYHSFQNSIQSASVDVLIADDKVGTSISSNCYVVEVASNPDNDSTYDSEDVLTLVENLYNRYH